MYASVAFIGFKPSEDEQGELNLKLNQLRELCPYDSYSQARVEKTSSSNYAVTISVKYADGEMKGVGKGEKLGAALMTSIDETYYEIKRWRNNRVFEDKQHARTPVKVLVVDDDPMSTHLMAACLRKLGCSIKTVMTPADAILEVTNRSYDLVVLDWIMPVMDGGRTLLEAQRIISSDSARDLEWAAERLPVVTFSGRENENIDFPDCRHFRRLDHWEKSLPKSELMARANRIVSHLQKEM